MRLIDGDELLTKGRYSHTNTDIANAPTVNAIPIDRIKQLREEIKGYKHGNGNLYTCALNKSVELIDNMIKEYEP